MVCFEKTQPHAGAAVPRYLGHVPWSQPIVSTAPSVSMIAEINLTAVPVGNHSHQPAHGTARLYFPQKNAWARTWDGADAVEHGHVTGVFPLLPVMLVLVPATRKHHLRVRKRPMPSSFIPDVPMLTPSTIPILLVFDNADFVQ